MGISKSTWSHKRNELLSNFSLYYEYEVEYEGRETKYHILKKLGDYQKIPNARNAAKRDAVYSEKIIEVIEEDNIQTAVNVARIIQTDDEIKEFNHKFGTIYEYSRLRMREMFGSNASEGGTRGRIMDKVWCRLDADANVYCPMSDEHINAFYEFFKNERQLASEIEIEAMNDCAIGLITKEEATAIISEQVYFGYKNARQEFKAKYGYTPIKVPVYGIYGIDITDFGKEEE